MIRTFTDKALIAFIFLACSLLVTPESRGEVLERIVAVVNDEVILLTEFQETFRTARESNPAVSEEEVLNGMISSMLLLIEAKRFRIGDADYQPRNNRNNRTVIREFIDRRIKAFIHIRQEDIEYYYHWNRELYDGKELYDVRDEIEKKLIEKELNTKLHTFMEELRKKAYISVQLAADE